MTIAQLREFVALNESDSGTFHDIIEEVDLLETKLKRKDEVIEKLRDTIHNLETELKVQQRLREKELNELKKKCYLYWGG